MNSGKKKGGDCNTCFLHRRLTDLEVFLEKQFKFLSMEQSAKVKKCVVDEWVDYLRRKNAVV